MFAEIFRWICELCDTIIWLCYTIIWLYDTIIWLVSMITFTLLLMFLISCLAVNFGDIKPVTTSTKIQKPHPNLQRVPKKPRSDLLRPYRERILNADIPPSPQLHMLTAAMSFHLTTEEQSLHEKFKNNYKGLRDEMHMSTNAIRNPIIKTKKCQKTIRLKTDLRNLRQQYFHVTIYLMLKMVETRWKKDHTKIKLKMFDQHLLHVKESEKILCFVILLLRLHLENYLKNEKDYKIHISQKNGEKYFYYRIVTGRGVHSENNISVLRRSTEAWLDNENNRIALGYEIIERNEGSFQISFNMKQFEDNSMDISIANAYNYHCIRDLYLPDY